MNLGIEPVPVQSVYSKFLKDIYIVNRRYQRKLVWSIEEKERFIDSLINGYPIPMIIGVDTKRNNENFFEILDGMQRLNAITAFIENEFSLHGKFFDLSVISHTKSLLENNKLTQKEPKLSVEECSIFLDYPVPFSICKEKDSKNIDESFRRINTGGKRLSKQDVRQAGALGTIPNLVRRCSIYVRGDSSHSDILALKDMKHISLSNKGLTYGIDLLNVFWVKHDIITYENIRQSRDEELVCQLLSYMACPKEAVTTSYYLDLLYDENSTENQMMTSKVKSITEDVLYNQFCFIYKEIDKTLKYSEKNFNELEYDSKANKISQTYQVVFIAFYKAMIRDNLEILNYKKICDALSNIYNKHLNILNNSTKWTSQDRDELSDSVLGIIRENFKQKNNIDRNFSPLVQSLENILNESATEQVCYDFKIGFHPMNANSEFSEDLLGKVIKTLAAMCNTKNGDCFVIIGVADTKNDADRHKSTYNCDYITYKASNQEFYITGIDLEAKKYHTTIDKYQQKMLRLIDKQPISEDFKSEICSNIIPFSYGEKEIIMFKARRSERPYTFDGKIFMRNLSHLKEITGDDLFTFYDRFKRENH